MYGGKPNRDNLLNIVTLSSRVSNALLRSKKPAQ